MSEHTDDLKVKLTNSCGSEFFDILGQHLNVKIPVTLKNVLSFNRYDNVSALSTFNNDSIKEIQECMRDVFEEAMLDDGEQISDYLGKFVKVQQKFIIVSGELRLIEKMTETCQRLYIHHPERNPLTQLDENELAQDTTDETLFNTIGSHMITIYNDAKRITLSGWSWPSRHVAAEIARNFKLGRRSLPDINLQYVTPTNHRAFTDCIVLSDIENFVECIRESLAISLRIDGSVDRTQKHNVFAMLQILKRDGNSNTLCLGFDVPKTPGAEGYLACLKSVVTKVLPWDEFFLLVSSIVTDGEKLNMGHLNGLVAKLKELRNLDQSNLPLLSIWCVAHRINLAWVAVSKIDIIASLITRARKLSTHFHNSAKRTGKLNDIAALNGLKTPLRYPSFFAVRWVEFVFNLFNVILRNWRASIMYFKAEKLQDQLDRWIHYDTLHCITVLTDVLFLVKKFQKSCQSDTLTLIDVSRLSDRLLEKLENCKAVPIEGGWEELFLNKVVTNGDNVSLCGIDLKTSPARRTRRNGISFTPDKRRYIVQNLIVRLKVRLNLDEHLLTAFKPLIKITLSTSQEELKLCRRTVVPDLNENDFITEYRTAAELLQGREFSSVLETLHKVIEISSDQLHILKVALARVVVAKPHSADVERLIYVYNKFKNPDRSSLSQGTLSNYLYINTNMGPLEKFDPTPAVQNWISKKNRHPKANNKAHLQEWFNGVFEQPPEIQKQNKQINTKIEF